MHLWGSARIARLSQQCLHENSPQLLEKEQSPPNNSIFECNVWGATHEAILKPSFEAQTVSESKVALEKIRGNILQVQLTKLSRVLQVV